MSNFIKVDDKNCKVKVILRLLVYYIKFTYLECTELTEVVGREGGYHPPPPPSSSKIIKRCPFLPQKSVFWFFKKFLLKNFAPPVKNYFRQSKRIIYMFIDEIKK